ncbi:hypothetical protein TraAM80_07098 [Trypanosoma rangeli]|uniref:Uncharacterized protein n=1 Tax=Trypanosoma rangeli TaxID=5698 RepID=A0A3R7KTX5_TRYRA|nr:uncharacterized protein TraAM80_07098 [Trypanosoma rangeli]RNF01301.1 hypothetical protein TraAM80_07098 [Trypanosoma rangeli]|eukprot:RNF01301.1 hypothetical protein TraAM80_07098 [Trypanosoma rangeli]
MATSMRRWGTAGALLGWFHLRHSRACLTEAHIRREIQHAIQRLGARSSPAWVAISCVSSTLSDETCEVLAELGGLAEFCRRSEESDEPHLAVKMVNGVLCVRQLEVKKPPVTQCVEVRSQKSVIDLKELCDNCSLLPDKPVPLTSCQSAWKLPYMEATVQRLVSIMERVERAVRRHTSETAMPLYVQVGYHGKKAIIVGLGPRSVSLLDQRQMEKVCTWDEVASPRYDLWRLSRYLRTDVFLPIDELLSLTDGVIQAPLLQVAMSYPERISFSLGPTMCVESADADRFYVNGDACNEIREVLGMKFLLSEAEVARHLTSKSEKLSGLTDEELQDERLKLKNMAPMRRQKLRRSIVREEFRRRFPHGNAFLNPNVVAFHIYDQMLPGVWVNNAAVRETLLPDGGKGAMHVGVDFFDQFPHLFITQCITTTSLNVMRREQGMEDVSSDGENLNHNAFSDEEILLFLLPRLTNKKEDWGDNKGIDVLAALLPRHVFKYMQNHGGAVSRLTAILKRYPEAFEVLETVEKSGVKEWRRVRLRYDGITKIGARLVNELQADERRTEFTQQQTRENEEGRCQTDKDGVSGSSTVPALGD